MGYKFFTLSNGRIVNRDAITVISPISAVESELKPDEHYYQFTICFDGDGFTTVDNPDLESAENELRDLINY